jgi:hypothetical protein
MRCRLRQQQNSLDAFAKGVPLYVGGRVFGITPSSYHSSDKLEIAIANSFEEWIRCLNQSRF